MKNVTLLMAFILFTNLLYSQEVVKEYYENGKIKTIGQYDENDYATGEWKKYYENGKLFQIGSFEDGDAIGVWKTYYENGQLEDIENFENSNKTGVQKYYYKNGQLSEIINYDNGEMKGERKKWFENGNVESIANVSPEGKYGEYKVYYENGQLNYGGNYENGEETGEWISYSEEGVKIEKKSYKEGKLLKEVSYYENGTPKILKEYTHRPMFRAISTIEYYPSGTISNKATEPIGKYTQLTDKNGNLLRLRVFQHDIERYYENGELHEKGRRAVNDEYDLKIGVWKTYYSNKNLQTEIPHSIYGINGEAKYYDENGNLTKTLTFIDGEEQ